MILLFSVGQSRTCTPESKADMNPQFDTTVPCIRDGASEYERARKFPTQNARKMAECNPLAWHIVICMRESPQSDPHKMTLFLSS